MTKVILIGGGTGGHIFPLRNLTDELVAKGVVVEIVVADQELDRKITQENFADTSVHFFKTGKIRRYFSFQNFIDIFRIIGSCWTARKMLKEIQPDVIFFKGGFVGFPFLVAAKFLMKFSGKIYSHESDISPGMLTKLAKRFSDETFESFSETSPLPLFYTPPLIPQSKSQSGSDTRILVFGGSQGSQFLNEIILSNADKLLEKYHITLVSGVGKAINLNHPNFTQYEFLTAEKLSEEVLASSIIIARGGANSLFEIIAAHKPSIIIPLPSVARNHQMLNARFFEKQNLCRVAEENSDIKNTLPQKIEEVLRNEKMKQALTQSHIQNSAQKIAEKILQSVRKN